MKLTWLFPALALVSVWLSGCTSTLDDKHSVAWVPWSKDTVEGRYEFTPAQLWTATKDVLRTQGTLVGEDMQRNVLEANVDQRKIYVKVEEFDTKISRVLVQARTKGGNSDLEMAAFIDKQIAVRLASGNLTPSTPTRKP